MSAHAQREFRLAGSENADAAPVGFDLMRVALVRALVLSPLFPHIFQVLTLGLMLWIAWLGFQLTPPEDVAGKLYAKSNLVSLLIWGLWWPTMVWIVVLFSRAWCAICPLELVSNVGERLGRSLGLNRFHLGSLLRSGIAMVAAYLVIQFLVAGANLHRMPSYTAAFIVVLLISAALSGLVMRDRAFCRGFCPVGMLLSVYGRGGVLAVRPASHTTCRACEDKGCIRHANRYLLDARSCPSLLNLPKLDTNRDCLLCGQCFKSCEPDNLQLLVRQPFHPADAREGRSSWPVTLFVMILSGFVTYELFSEWKTAQALFLWPSNWASARLGLPGMAGWVKGMWMLAVFPILLWLILWLVARMAKGATGMGDAWRRLAIPVAVLLAGGHMAKGLAKIASWGGYLPEALRNPDGYAFSRSITSGELSTPAHLLPMTAVSAIGIVLVAAGFTFAIREARLSGNIRLRPVIAVLAASLTTLVLGWSFGA